MSTEPGLATYQRTQRTNDIMIVSSLALWAMVLGFLPIAVLRFIGA